MQASRHSTRIYAPRPGEFDHVQVFAARFPMGAPNIARSGWHMERPGAAAGRDAELGPYTLTDTNNVRWQGTPQSKRPSGHECCYFALVKRQGRTVAVPLEWTYIFKRDRNTAATLDDVDHSLSKLKRQEQEAAKKLKLRYHLGGADNGSGAPHPSLAPVPPGPPGENGGWVIGDAEVDALFDLDGKGEGMEDGWDFAEDIANEDAEVAPSREVAQEAAEEEREVLEAEGDELARQLRHEGRAAGPGGPALRADWGDDDAPGARSGEDAAEENEKRRHIRRLRRNLKRHSLAGMAGYPMMSSDSEDESDEDEEASGSGHGRSSGEATPAASPLRPSPPPLSVPTASASPSSAVASKRPGSQDAGKQKKRQRTSSRPHSLRPSVTPTASGSSSPQMSTSTVASIAEMDSSVYALIKVQTQELWPRTLDGGYVTELTLKQALDVVTRASKAVLQGSPGNHLIKQIFQTANKGAHGKPKFLKIAAKTADNKSLINLILGA